MRFLAASTIALLYAASTLAAPWIGKVPPPYKPLQASRAKHVFSISDSVYRTDRVKYEVHMGPQPFQSWVQQTIDFSYIKPVFDQIQRTDQRQLTTRSEAHITLITPPEYDQVLKPAGVTMDDLNRLAVKMGIQKAEFKIKCLGRARVALNHPGQQEEVYFIVVDSPDLIRIRQEIQKMYLKKGGEPSLFDAEAFWPHITVGFTARDMFMNDGVWKDTNSCWADVHAFSDWNRPRSLPRLSESADSTTDSADSADNSDSNDGTDSTENDADDQ